MASSSPSSRQPPGRVIHERGEPQDSFNIWTVPDIPTGTFMVGALGPDFDQAQPSKHAWMVSDMYAFNYLVRKVSSNQKWLAVNTEQQLLRQYGDYVHGNVHKERRIVLSQQLLDDNEITKVEPVAPEHMIQRTLEAIKQACVGANAQGVPVVIFLFAHGNSTEYDIMLNAKDKRRGLRPSQLVEVIDPAVRVSLITNSCYSGGWTTFPDLNISVHAVASFKRRSYSWGISASLRRAGGSVFASTLIESICDLKTALSLSEQQTTAEQSSKAQSSTIPDVGQSSSSLTETHNAFVHVVEKTLRREMSQSCRHEFHFSAQNDEWEKSWIRRTGIPLQRFADRWELLKGYKGKEYYAKLKGKGPRYTDENPDNPDYSDFVWQQALEESESSMTEGTSSGPSNWTLSAAGKTSPSKSTKIPTFRLPPGGLRRLRFQAQQMLDACPWEWTAGNQVATGNLLRKFAEEGSPGLAYEVFQTLRFRESYMNYVDFLVEYHGMKPPIGFSCCLKWCDWVWITQAKHRHPKAEEHWDRIDKELTRRGCMLYPHGEQGPVFDNPIRYMAAAIIDANLTEKESFAKVDAIANFVARDQHLLSKELAEKEEIKVATKKWRGWEKMKSSLRSLSPTKRSRASTTSAH